MLASAALVCGCGPRPPRQLTFDGARLEKAASWSKGDVSAVVFIPPGERLERASLQVGILVSTGHPSGEELHRWMIDQYRHSPTQQWHEDATAEEDCKVGLGPGPPRPFLAVQICRSIPGGSACAEADEQLSDEQVGRCLNRQSGCWDELCNQRWASRRQSLEAILKGLAGG